MHSLVYRAGGSSRLLLLLTLTGVSFAQTAPALPAGGTIWVVAGTGYKGSIGAGGPAISAELDGVDALAVDPSGVIYIAESRDYRVRRVGADGKIVAVAGNGTYGFSGDGQPATKASFSGPDAIAADGAGNLYIAADNRVRKVTPAGIIGTVAGGGSAFSGSNGDGGPAIGATLQYPVAIAVDGNGNLYIAERARVRKVTVAGIISTVAGNGTYGSTGDGGSATAAQVSPSEVTLDSGGNLFIAEWYNGRVRKVTTDGTIRTFAGSGSTSITSPLGDGGPATSAPIPNPDAITVDPAGNLYIATWGRVRKVTPASIINTVVGRDLNYEGDYSKYCCDGILATSARVSSSLSGVATDAAGNLYVGDSQKCQVYKVAAEKYAGTTPPDVGAVMNAADYRAAIAPYTWISITGTNLSSTARAWGDADFVSGQLPTQLDGVRVWVEGWPAAISYISPTQINALVVHRWDSDPGSLSGNVPVEVTTSQGRSDPLPVARNGCSPGLFRLNVEGGKWVVANAPDGTLIGQPGLIPGLTTRPARPGDVLAGYATGLGPTNPATPAGILVSAPAVLAKDTYLNTSWGRVSPAWAGLIGPGLYQLNFVVPTDASDGDYQITPVGCGYTTGGDAWITIKR
jgi:uncharacterized protein (TIGR03437 family)